MCHNSDAILTSTLPPSVSAFQEKVMYLVHWLFIIGTIEFVCPIVQYIIWAISMKRQISRMSVRLFESLIQRGHVPNRDAPIPNLEYVGLG
ncbi:unnamed protein product [Rotaria magnacalcarata]|uniref:Uncharacterized protein n=1 Tax=Rotaria magnacalcarata TaxID=392030 RepID=A0A820IP45_9BILA|nr:unnamed protein product [Rotaria magnacalcarata]CAF4312494.1 unnamed protein product [Rotaria magnacalcarata]